MKKCFCIWFASSPYLGQGLPLWLRWLQTHNSLPSASWTLGLQACPTTPAACTCDLGVLWKGRSLHSNLYLNIMEQKCSFIHLMYIKYLCSCYMNIYLAYKCIHTSTRDRFALYMSYPTRSMPFHKDTQGCLRTFCENTLGPTFWHSEMRHKEAYQKDEFTAGSAELETETQETWRGSYWGSHMQHIYTVQQGGGAGPDSGTADRALKREKREYKAKTPVHPHQGQDRCQDLTAKSRMGL